MWSTTTSAQNSGTWETSSAMKTARAQEALDRRNAASPPMPHAAAARRSLLASALAPRDCCRSPVSPAASARHRCSSDRRARASTTPCRATGWQRWALAARHSSALPQKDALVRCGECDASLRHPLYPHENLGRSSDTVTRQVQIALRGKRQAVLLTWPPHRRRWRGHSAQRSPFSRRADGQMAAPAV